MSTRVLRSRPEAIKRPRVGPSGVMCAAKMQAGTAQEAWVGFDSWSNLKLWPGYGAPIIPAT